MNAKTIMSGICKKEHFMLFDKPCTKEEFEAGWAVILPINFLLTEWLYSPQMTDKEKAEHPNHTVCNGYLKVYEYKEAWVNAFKSVDKETIGKIKALKNFDSDTFFEITGVRI